MNNAVLRKEENKTLHLQINIQLIKITKRSIYIVFIENKLLNNCQLKHCNY